MSKNVRKKAAGRITREKGKVPEERKIEDQFLEPNGAGKTPHKEAKIQKAEPKGGKKKKPSSQRT